MERFLKSKYKIGQQIAENPFSVTYKGSGLVNDNPLIIKIYKRGTLNSSLISRMKQKVKELTAINKPEIVKLVDGDYGWQGFYYVREYVKGISLEEVLKSKKKLSLEKIEEIIQEICQALDAAHKRGIIHGGLKPSNIFFDSKGKVRVADFVIEGDIRQAMPQKAIAVLEDSNFSSPEELLGNPATFLSDIYSLGLILLLLVSPEKNYLSEKIYNGLEKLKSKIYEPEALNNLPRYLQDIIIRALQTDPKLRFKSVAEFKESLMNKNLLIRPAEEEEYLEIFENSVNEDGEEIRHEETQREAELKRQKKDRFLVWIIAALLLTSIFSGLSYVFFFSR